MKSRRRVLWAALCAAVVLLAAVGARADVITIDTVTIGNPGNAADTTGYGAVAYDYSIGKYEVTAGQYTAFLNAVAATDTHDLYNTNMWSHAAGCKIQRTDSSGSYTYSVASNYANRPVNYVSFWDAARFVNWLHNGQPTGAQGAGTTEAGAYINIGTQATFARQPGALYWIPTEDEWYKAAYYDPSKGSTGGYWLYPTGSSNVPGQDMSESTNAGNNANYHNTSDTPYPLDPPSYTTEVGEFELSHSPYGTFDQGGNVWEWTEAIIEETKRSLRGGCYGVNEDDLCASNRYGSYPSSEGSRIGFRVASIPEPASVAILLMGAVGMLLWRRRRNA